MTVRIFRGAMVAKARVGNVHVLLSDIGMLASARDVAILAVR